MLTKIFIVFSATILNVRLAALLVRPSEPHSLAALVDTVAGVLECQENNGLAVGVVGYLEDPYIRTLQSRLSLPIALLDSRARQTNLDPVERAMRTKLDAFVVRARSLANLRKNLRVTKNSIWWNSFASIVIITWSSLPREDCTMAREILWTAWEADLPNAKFICVHWTKGSLVYSYNPYSQKAPQAWQVSRVFPGRNDHPWTLLVRRYENLTICQSLDFDSTKDMEGYPILCTVKASKVFRTIPGKSGLESFTGFDGSVVRIVFDTLNATFRRRNYHEPGGPQYLDKHGHDIMQEMMSGLTEFGLNARAQFILANVTSLYPHREHWLGILTQRRGFMSVLDKSIYTLRTICQPAFWLLILLVVGSFKIVLHSHGIPAFVSALRVFGGQSFPKVPRNLSSRIFLFFTLLIVLITLIYYQGEVSARLTKPVPRRNVDTGEDLLELNYTVYVNRQYVTLLRSAGFEANIVELDAFDCEQYVLSASTAACIRYKYLLYDVAVDLELYLSSAGFQRVYGAFAVRYDWPLERTVNRILGRMSEGGIIDYLHMMDNMINQYRYLAYKHQVEIWTYRDMSIREVSITLVILVAGLTCATVVFVLEIVTLKCVVDVESSVRRVKRIVQNRIRAIATRLNNTKGSVRSRDEFVINTSFT